MQPSGRREGLAVLALCAVLAVQLGLGTVSDGLTNDEVLYIPDGHRYLAGDFRMDPTHPPLAKALVASGLLGLKTVWPEERAGEALLHWSYRCVLEAREPGRIILRARLPVCALTVLTALLLWGWARAAGGVVAGLAALGLAAFHPSLLAHGHLATTDMAAASTFVLGSWALWWWIRQPGVLRALAVGTAIGLAAATKLTGLLLVPSLTLVLTWDALRGPVPRRWSGRDIAILGLAVAVCTPLVIWATYGFRYDSWPGAAALAHIPPRLGLPGKVILALESLHALPQGYLDGARFQVAHALTGHPGYLLGEHSRTGWWHYHLVAFLVKSTPGFLLATAAAVYWALRRGVGPIAHWTIPACVVALAASAGRVQIGERYLLPVNLYLILLAAAAAPALLRDRRGRWMAAAIFALHAGPALGEARDGYLSYFNLLAGGREGGHRVLLDSNLDWGQDLPRLAAWMRRERVPVVQLAYHGADDPDRFGIAHEDLPGLHLHPSRPAPRPFQGTVAVSPNLLFALVPSAGDPYAFLRERRPDARAGVFFIYRLGDAKAKLPSRGP